MTVAIERRLFVYRRPGPGAYQESGVSGPKDRVSPLALPDVVLRVRDLLP